MAVKRLAHLLLFILLWCGVAMPQDLHLISRITYLDQQDAVDDPSNMVDMAIASGSSGYSAKTGVAYADNHYNCYAGVRNCWGKTTVGQLTQNSVGVDGYYLGVNSAYQVYHLPTTTNGSQQPWQYLSALNGVSFVAVANQTGSVRFAS